ncbi:hypothetical protein CSQ85_09185 [Bifidobacterium rousetti]|uniref:DUF5067 domain-containing protein n=1 Tax=Bifidobacterium rousetti TaxID=2045439 RepID=UPI001239A7E9|nr:DUF5067 domain-containing protein [Bifidobacterium rousetti]KAA8818324.1 hypothetical protein CSQ85_09185 [Bifidobacterium rousetti]
MSEDRNTTPKAGKVPNPALTWITGHARTLIAALVAVMVIILAGLAIHDSWQQSVNANGDPIRVLRDKGDVPGAHIEFTGSHITSDHQYLLATLRWTNNTKETTIFDRLLTIRAYVNDTAIERADTPATPIKGYKTGTTTVEVKPGETGTVTVPFALDPSSNAIMAKVRVNASFNTKPITVEHLARLTVTGK